MNGILYPAKNEQSHEKISLVSYKATTSYYLPSAITS